MHISLARRHCTVSMKYYNERMATLERNFPQALPYKIDMKTEFIENEFPITYVTMSWHGEIIKTWALIVDATGIDELSETNSEVCYVNLQKIASWHKAKRIILEDIKQELDAVMIKNA